jgi:hypothetical protein
MATTRAGPATFFPAPRRRYAQTVPYRALTFAYTSATATLFASSDAVASIGVTPRRVSHLL